MAKDQQFKNEQLPGEKPMTKDEVIDLCQQIVADFAGTSTYRKGVTSGVTVSGITFTALPIGWQGVGGTTSKTLEINGNAVVSGTNTGDNAVNSSSLPIGGGTLTGDLTMTDAKNIVAGTTTGTKFGASDTAKISLYSATPIVRQNHLSDPTGGATVDAEARTAINAILVALENIGILKTS